MCRFLIKGKTFSQERPGNGTFPVAILNIMHPKAQRSVSQVDEQSSIISGARQLTVPTKVPLRVAKSGEFCICITSLAKPQDSSAPYPANSATSSSKSLSFYFFASPKSIYKKHNKRSTKSLWCVTHLRTKNLNMSLPSLSSSDDQASNFAALNLYALFLNFTDRQVCERAGLCRLSQVACLICLVCQLNLLNLHFCNSQTQSKDSCHPIHTENKNSVSYTLKLFPINFPQKCLKKTFY